MTTQAAAASRCRETYDGERNAKGQRHGTGVATWANGDVYSGEWAGGFPHGTGRFRFASGDEYAGAVRWGRRWGEGTYWHSDGGVYTGGFADDREDGRGRRVWPGGDVHEGDWRRGYMDGFGTVRCASGERYVGWLALSQREGRGSLRRPDGSRYAGMWSRGARDGACGTLVLADGSGYHGQWRDDRPHGDGAWFEATPGAVRAGGAGWDAGVLRSEGGGSVSFDTADVLPPMRQSVRYPEAAEGAEDLSGPPLSALWWADRVEGAEHLSHRLWVERGEPGVAGGSGDSQGMFEGSPPRRMSARAAYEDSCRDAGARVNAQLRAGLPAEVTTHELRRIDASPTYLGGPGAAAVVRLLGRCPNVTEVDLSQQNLSAAALAALCGVCEGHPSVKRLNLSGNLVEHGAAKRLSRLCACAARLEVVSLDETGVNKGVATQIAQRLQHNKRVDRSRVLTGIVQ